MISIVPLLEKETGDTLRQSKKIPPSLFHRTTASSRMAGFRFNRRYKLPALLRTITKKAPSKICKQRAKLLDGELVDQFASKSFGEKLAIFRRILMAIHLNNPSIIRSL